MIAALPGRRDDAAELALQSVDGGAEASEIDEIVVRLAIEIGDRALECHEFRRHEGIVRTLVWNVQNRSVNLYAPKRRRGPPGIPPRPLHSPLPAIRSS